ncbi:MAG: hypothetical protein IJZ19_10465 [Lentisphaeria bacterium]|nr:hypothetical protein [Lentisphaeria bacterium]
MRLWRDKIVHFLPFWLFGLALFMKIMFLLTEFSLTFVENKKLLYDFQDSWMGRDELPEIIFFSAIYSSFIWIFLIFFFRRKHKLLCAIGFLLAPVIMSIIINLLPHRPCVLRREFNPRAACTANMKQLGYVLAMYALDNNDFYPDNLKMILNYYGKKTLFRCPETKTNGYIYHGKGKKISDPIFVLLEDKIENHRGNFKNLLMSDNDVIRVKKIK